MEVFMAQEKRKGMEDTNEKKGRPQTTREEEERSTVHKTPGKAPASSGKSMPSSPKKTR
jgi:hypothetical protein